MKEEKTMSDDKKCDKYEAYFTFKSEEEFQNHLKECPDCQKEHELQKKVSALIKEAAPVYLKRQEKKKISNIRKLACCFVLFVGLSAFTGYKIYDENSFQANNPDESYISLIGLPTDDYGFLEL